MDPNFNDSAERDNSSDQPSDSRDGWSDVYESCESGLRAFLQSRLAQSADVDDCLQVVLVKMLQSGQDVAPAARRAWLFRVAANESARFWRHQSTTKRVLEKRASNLDDTANESTHDDLADPIILSETNQQIRQAITQLPEATQQIIHLRIHENLTFQQIADQLNIPLGTALTRLRRGLEILKNDLSNDES